MADALFDTSVFIDYYRGHSGAHRLVEQVVSGAFTASYSSITVFELWLGGMDQQEMRVHQTLLALLEEAHFDATIARRAAVLLRPLPLAERRRLVTISKHVP